jgi:integrase
MGGLTDVAIRNTKPAAKPRKLSDGHGLHLLVTTAGGKLWRLQYRYDGKQRMLALGAYPDVSLSEARTKVEEAREALRGGRDPSIQARIAKLTQSITAANTFGLIADEYLAKYAREGRAEATIVKAKWLIDFARPSLGDRPITEITPIELLAVLRQVEGRGRLHSAGRLRTMIGGVFRYAIATARAKEDPTYALRGALMVPKTQSRAAIVDPAGLGGLLRAIDGFEGQPTTKAALQLMALLFPRPGELRAAEWSEFDLKAGVWSIPAAHTKMRRPHRVPLSPQAVAVLTELKVITGRSNLVLHSVRTVREPISENTLNAALRRLGYSKDEMTAHGFRATASTLLNESGKWNPDAIERQLAHVEGNDVRRVYARGEHWKERAEMMAWWADHLDELRARLPQAVAA